jgi:hypothetical protein
VRHALVQRIVRAYESATPRQQELPLALADTIGDAEPAREPLTSPHPGAHQGAHPGAHPGKPQ